MPADAKEVPAAQPLQSFKSVFTTPFKHLNLVDNAPVNQPWFERLVFLGGGTLAHLEQILSDDEACAFREVGPRAGCDVHGTIDLYHVEVRQYLNAPGAFHHEGWVFGRVADAAGTGYMLMPIKRDSDGDLDIVQHVRRHFPFKAPSVAGGGHHAAPS